MSLIRCTEQKSQTLEEFYKGFIPNVTETFADVGTPMLQVLKLINDTFTETVIYGLTSHSTLVLQNEDSWESPWFVAIKGIVTIPNGQRNEYYIEYAMPSDSQPWQNAIVKGETTSLTELKKYIIIAMIESKGWTESTELKKLYKEI